MVMNERKEVRKSRVSQEERTMRKSDIDSKHPTKNKLKQVETKRRKEAKKAGQMSLTGGERKQGAYMKIEHRQNNQTMKYSHSLLHHRESNETSVENMYILE